MSHIHKYSTFGPPVTTAMSPVPPLYHRNDGLRPTDLKDIICRSLQLFFARRRPEEMNQDDAPFYLAVNNTLKADSLARKGWFKSGAVGVNN